ncbi:MAG: hypothetical protein QXP94_05870 [Thermofilaceae archaeon]
MHDVVAAVLEMVKGVALTMTIVAAGSQALKLLSLLLREVEGSG